MVIKDFTKDNLSAMTKKELLNIAARFQIIGRDRMRKEKLISYISFANEQQDIHN